MELKIELLKGIIENIPYGVCFVNRDGKVVLWNKGAEILSGFGRLEVLGCDFDYFGDKSCPVKRTLKNKISQRADIKLRRKGGKEIPVFAKTSVLFSDDGKFEGVIATFSNNSFKEEMKGKVETLERVASFDFLTSLHNRRAIEKVMFERLSELIRNGNQFGVLFIDVDDFKNINDKYGHDTGDRVLKMVSEKLAVNLRPFDFLGRWGGEEFVAIVANVHKQELYTVANRFREIVEKSSFFTGSNLIKVTISTGVAVANKSDSVVSLLKRADELMYKSKKLGKNKVSIEVGL